MKIERILQQRNDALDISEDARVYGKTDKEHNKNLKKLLEVSIKMVLHTTPANV